MSPLPFDPLLIAIATPLALALLIGLGLPKRWSVRLAYVAFAVPLLMALHAWWHFSTAPQARHLMKLSWVKRQGAKAVLIPSAERLRARLTPTVPQAEFLHNFDERLCKFNAFVGGVGSGKSHLGLIEGVLKKQIQSPTPKIDGAPSRLLSR